METNHREDLQQQRLARIQHNPWLVCAYHGAHMAMFSIAVLTLCLVDDLKFSMADVFLLEAIFAVAVAALEFPFGYLADRIGYRRSLVLAAGLGSLGWLLYALGDTFASILIAELVLAAGLALCSGADTALLYESLLAGGKEHLGARWFARYRFASQVGEGTAALLGGVLYAHWHRGPFFLTSVMGVVALLLALRMVEPERGKAAGTPAGRHMFALVRFALVDSPRLRALVLTFVALSLPTFYLVWILPTYAQQAGVDVAYIGVIWAGASYVVALGALLSPRLGQRLGWLNTLLLCVALIAIGYVGMGSSRGTYGFLFYAALSLCRGLQGPLLSHEEQRLIPSSDRAGLGSVRSLVFRLAFAVTGPLVGHMFDEGDHYRVLLLLAGPLSLLAAASWLYLSRSRGPQPAPEPAVLAATPDDA